MKSGLRLLQRHGLDACKQLDPRKLQISKAKFHCSVTEKCQGICTFISTVCDFAVICKIAHSRNEARIPGSSQDT